MTTVCTPLPTVSPEACLSAPVLTGTDGGVGVLLLIKTCHKCGKSKSLDNFYKHCREKSGYRNPCKQCIKQQTKTTEQKNHLKQWCKEYYRRDDRYKKLQEYRKSEAWRIIHQRAMYKWTRTEHGKINRCIAHHRRRALQLNAPKGTPYVDWAEEIRRQPSFTCSWCGKEFSTDKFTIDHIIPLYLGGLDGLENVCASCGPCNSKKGHLPLEVVNKIFGKETTGTTQT